MWKCASQCPDIFLVLIFVWLYYWLRMYIVLFILFYICKGLYYCPEYGLHWWIFYMLLRRTHIMLLLVRVFYKWKLSEVDNIFSLLVLSITGKEISKPPNITVNLFISSMKSIGYCLMYFEALDIYAFLKSTIKKFINFLYSNNYLKIWYLPEIKKQCEPHPIASRIKIQLLL